MLTILFATKNGAALLPGVLDAYAQLAAPPGGWRLVIVDNGSTDDTPRILQASTGKLPLTVLHEGRPGKNAALNTGLGHIAGDLVALTDDDVFPHPDWLIELRRAADEHPEASVFGGRVLPRWQSPPPDWIVEFVPKGPTFALTEPQWHNEGAIAPDLIFGPNMAVRAAIFREGFRFDESIGPKGKSYAMGSESEFTNRVARAGYRSWFCPGMVVEHFIPAPHLDRRWILNRSMRYGRGRYRLKDRFIYADSRTLLGVPRYLCWLAVKAAWAFLRETLRGNDRRRFEAHWHLNFCLGEIMEARSLARMAAPTAYPSANR